MKSLYEMSGVESYPPLDRGIDWRDVRYRKLLFTSLLEFNTRFSLQSDSAYLYLPAIAREFNADAEQLYWLLFLEAIISESSSVYPVFSAFPALPSSPAELTRLEKWFSKNAHRLNFDHTRLWEKKNTVEVVRAYVSLLGGRTQEEYFDQFYRADGTEAHGLMFGNVFGHFKSFGRFSTGIYLEYMAVLIPKWREMDSDGFFIEMGSSSRTLYNGLMQALGRPDLVVTKPHAISRPDAAEAEALAKVLRGEIRQRLGGRDWSNHLTTFAISELLCYFQNLFKGKRYPGYYADVACKSIRSAEAGWPELDFSPLWEARKAIPAELRLEDNPRDPGACKEKQGYFARTGQLPMMWVLDPAFNCGWRATYYGDDSCLF